MIAINREKWMSSQPILPLKLLSNQEGAFTFSSTVKEG